MNRGRNRIAGLVLMMASFGLGSFLPRSSAQPPAIPAPTLGRYSAQLIAAAERYVVVTDSFAGRAWTRLLPRSENWTDLGIPPVAN